MSAELDRDEARYSDLYTWLREQWELLDRQRTNPNETIAGRAILERIGRTERVSAALVKDVGRLMAWRKGLRRSILRGSIRTIEASARLAAAAIAIIATVVGTLWTLHQLGIVR